MPLVVYRVAITVTVIFLVCSGVFFIGPITKYYTSIENGTCRVSSVSWKYAWCEENRMDYFVPVISADFRNLTNTGYEVSTYTGLFINIHEADLDETGYKATIFDDGTDDALVQCEWSFPGTDNFEMNQKLAEYIPYLTAEGSGFNASSLYPSYITNVSVMERFDCQLDKTHAVLYLEYPKPNVYLSIVFAIAVPLHIIVSFLVVTKDEEDSIWMHIATLTVMGVYLVHMVLYLIIYIPCVSFGKQLPDHDQVFKKGSILFPIFWLFKKLKDCSCPRSSSSTPPPPRRDSVPVSAVSITPPLPRRDTRRDSIRTPVSTTPPPTRRNRGRVTAGHHSHRRSSSDPTLSLDTLSGPINYPIHSVSPSAPPPVFTSTEGPPLYNDLVIENENNLPPPPSYDEVVRGEP